MGIFFRVEKHSEDNGKYAVLTKEKEKQQAKERKLLKEKIKMMIMREHNSNARDVHNYCKHNNYKRNEYVYANCACIVLSSQVTEASHSLYC